MADFIFELLNEVTANGVAFLAECRTEGRTGDVPEGLRSGRHRRDTTVRQSSQLHV